jgi:hypothetical protein
MVICWVHMGQMKFLKIRGIKDAYSHMDFVLLSHLLRCVMVLMFLTIP